MNYVNQKSTGSGAHNINGDGNIFVTVNPESTRALKAKTVTEVRSIMKLISLLSNKASVELKEVVIDTETEKNIDLKINNRFKDFKSQLLDDYQRLLPHYSEKSKEAWDESEITESKAGEIINYLMHISRKVLKDCGNDPIQALDKLTASLEEELKSIDTEETFSNGAIRYYLLQELINCNIFPNPLE